MAHFGILQEHKDILRKNRLFLLYEMNSEPVIQRLRQSNILTHLNMENIQAVCPMNYHKNEKVIVILPKRGPCAFAYFCRALSASGQNHIRNQIQPEGVTWSIGLSTVQKYDGKILYLQKGSRSISITHGEWNNLISYIPKILEKSGPLQRLQVLSE